MVEGSTIKGTRLRRDKENPGKERDEEEEEEKEEEEEEEQVEREGGLSVCEEANTSGANESQDD